MCGWLGQISQSKLKIKNEFIVINQSDILDNCANISIRQRDVYFLDNMFYEVSVYEVEYIYYNSH